MKELSEFLRSERVARGLTLQDVSTRTGLSVHILQILEEGSCEKIGTALLISNFLRCYCAALDIDPAPLLEKYESQILSYDGQQKGIERYGAWSRAFRRPRRIGLFGILILGAAIIGASYGGAWYYNRKVRLAQTGLTEVVYPQQELPPDLPNGNGARSDIAPGKQPAQGSDRVDTSPPETAARETAKADAPVPVGNVQEPGLSKSFAEGDRPSVALADVKREAVALKSEGHRFEVAAEQPTWIGVKADGKNAQSALLQPGEKRTWHADESMSVVVGNGGGVRMKWDDQPLSITGKPGQVLRFSLPEPKQARKQKPPGTRNAE